MYSDAFLADTRIDADAVNTVTQGRSHGLKTDAEL